MPRCLSAAISERIAATSAAVPLTGELPQVRYAVYYRSDRDSQFRKRVTELARDIVDHGAGDEQEVALVPRAQDIVKSQGDIVAEIIE